MKASLNIIIILFALTIPVCQGKGIDTIRVISHNEVVVQTNPAEGVNTYSRWAVFPNAKTSIRKLSMSVTLQCPDSLMCGEWDYMDQILLKRAGGANSQILNYEIGRIMTPYGRFFQSDWFFTFEADITEFSSLMRDSCEIVYLHSGFEAKEDRGWKITIAFECIEGPAPAPILSVQPLFCGNFPYGNPNNSIENYLPNIEIYASDKTFFMSLLITQSGHGMDMTENCAEFCSKLRTIIWDTSVINEKRIWRECASNPIQPQGGTWIFDRAGWCPGELVHPDKYLFHVPANSLHTLNIDMQAYTDTSAEPSAQYAIQSYLVSYGKARTKTDVSIEDIRVPPVSSNVQTSSDLMNVEVLIKNNGSDNLKGVQLSYGFNGETDMNYFIECNIPFGASEWIVLNNCYALDESYESFTVTAVVKNDGWKTDNSMSIPWPSPELIPEKFIVSFKTNNDSTQTKWFIVNHKGQMVAKSQDILYSNTTYYDTLSLENGSYQFFVSDTAGDGLEYWFFPESGMGHIRLLTIDGKLIKNFNPDFGNGIRFPFQIDNERVFEPNSETSLIYCYPVRCKDGKTNLNMLFNKPTDIHFVIKKDENSIIDQQIKQIYSTILPIDLSAYGPGIYTISVEYATVIKKMRIKVI